jgi:hypothetical protein
MSEQARSAIVEFLQARLAEDREGALLPGSERRLLREVEAKGQIVAEYMQREKSRYEWEEEGALDQVLSALAAVYAGHPEYDADWGRR